MKSDSDFYFDLLYRMKRIRKIEEKIACKYSEWKMRCPTHLSIGQEAVAVAAGAVLNNSDFAVSTHRAHAHYLGKGGDLNSMIAEIYGKKTGCSRGRGGSMHLIDTSVGFMGSTAIVGNSIPIGVGLGLSIQLNETDQISCIFLGDGATEEGTFYESANFAALKKLPVLFICENNLYSVYSPLSVRQAEKRKIYEMVNGMGIKSIACDGNNVLDACSTIKQSVDDIRKGQGPHFLEFATYRWREHCGPNYDNDIGYRTEEEFKAWKKLDPIQRLSEKIIMKFGNCPERNKAIDNLIQEEIEQAFQYAEDSPFPASSEASLGVYKD